MKTLLDEVLYMHEKKLSLEDRVAVLETLIDAAIWGPYLDNKDHRQKIANNSTFGNAIRRRKTGLSF